MSATSRQKSLLAAFCLIFIGSIFLSLRTGAVKEYDEQVFLILRLPRTITAIAIGGGLGVAGALIQATLGNPLADPYTIGIASAAAVGAVIGSFFHGNPLLGSTALAFAFSMGSLLGLSLWLRASFRHSTEVLLAGIVVGFFFTSIASLIMALSNPAEWSTAIVWLMGELGRLTYGESVATLVVILLLVSIGWLHWKPLDLLAGGDMAAESVGVDVEFYRKRMFILVALLTAVCVAACGVIGFLGLVVPHILRKLGIRGHFLLVPFSFLLGAEVLLVSDVVARVVVRPSEIPVGVLLALFGAPAFLYLAKRSREEFA